MPTKEEREKERKRKQKLAEQGKKGGKPVSRGLNVQNRLELEKARAGRAGTEAPVIRDDRVAKPSTFEQEQARVAGEPARAEQAAREAKAKEFLEPKGFFEEMGRRPERQELDIVREGVEKTPILGPVAAAGEQVLAPIIGFPLTALASPVLAARLLKDKAARGETPELTEEELLVIQDPETLREVALQEIQRAEIRKGLSISEETGAMIEAMPVIGSDLVGKYASELIEDPSGNVETITAIVKEMTAQAANMREKALRGTMGDPFVAYEQMETQEEDIARLEQRIKLLSLSSANLIADGDTLNLIETIIMEAKRRTFDAKQSAAFGLLSGPATPSDSSIYLALQGLNQGGKT